MTCHMTMSWRPRGAAIVTTCHWRSIRLRRESNGLSTRSLLWRRSSTSALGLLRARAAILGEPEPVLRATALQPHVKREDVFHYLARNPGSRPGEIAAGLGVGQQVVSAHLYRGKGRLFASCFGRWYPVPEADPRGSL